MVSARTLSAPERGGAERPGDGCPCVGAEEICGAPPLLSEGRNEGEHRGNHDKTVFWLSRKSTTPRKVIVLPGGWSVATLPTSALNPAVGVTCSEAS